MVFRRVLFQSRPAAASSSRSVKGFFRRRVEKERAVRRRAALFHAETASERRLWGGERPYPSFVIPATAGIQCGVSRRTLWIPSFAGMTRLSKIGIAHV